MSIRLRCGVCDELTWTDATVLCDALKNGSRHATHPNMSLCTESAMCIKRKRFMNGTSISSAISSASPALLPAPEVHSVTGVIL